METEGGGGGSPDHVSGVGPTVSGVSACGEAPCIGQAWLGTSQGNLVSPVVPVLPLPASTGSMPVCTGDTERVLTRKRISVSDDVSASASCKRTKTDVHLDFFNGGLARAPFILDFADGSVRPLPEYDSLRESAGGVSCRVAAANEHPSGGNSQRTVGARKRARQDSWPSVQIPERRSRTSFTPSTMVSSAIDMRASPTGVAAVFGSHHGFTSVLDAVAHSLVDNSVSTNNVGCLPIPVTAPLVFSTAVTTVPGDTCIQHSRDTPYGLGSAETCPTFQQLTSPRIRRPTTHRRGTSARGRGCEGARISEQQCLANDARSVAGVPVGGAHNTSRAPVSLANSPLYSETSQVSMEGGFVSGSHAFTSAPALDVGDGGTCNRRGAAPIATLRAGLSSVETSPRFRQVTSARIRRPTTQCGK